VSEVWIRRDLILGYETWPRLNDNSKHACEGRRFQEKARMETILLARDGSSRLITGQFVFGVDLTQLATFGNYTLRRLPFFFVEENSVKLIP
jgi:hypothetical protein